MGRRGLWITALALMMTTFGLAPAAATGQTHVVDDDGVQCPSAGFSSIQAAVDAATAGDTVVVCEGVYDESLTIGTPSITVCGAAPGTSACSLVCGPPSPACEQSGAEVLVDASDTTANFVVRVTAGDVTIKGLSIVAGVAQSGVDIRTGDVRIEDNSIVSTATDDDGELQKRIRTIGVNVVGGRATVTGNHLAGWIANAVGVWRGDATVSDNVFVGNRVGVHLADAADGTQVARNTFKAHLWPVRVAGEATSLTVSDNDLGPTNAFALRIEPDVDGLQISAPDNWWGVLGCAAIQERIDDPEATSSVDVTPYRGPTGEAIGPDGLLDPSTDDPTCEA